MSTPNSVTGPDRRPTTDSGRRAGGRRGDGGEEFGSALAAELDRGTPDAEQRESRQPAVRERAIQERSIRNRADQDRAFQNRAAQDRAADRAAQNRRTDD